MDRDSMWKMQIIRGGCAEIKAPWLLWFLRLLFIFDSPAHFPPPFSSNQWCHVKTWEGKGNSDRERHIVHLMIASETPLDFIMEFNTRRTTAVLLLFLFHIVNVGTTSPDQAARPSISASRSQFSSPYCTLSHSPPSHFLIFTSQWFKYLSSYFSFCFCLPVFILNHLYILSPLSLSLCNLHISIFFFSYPCFRFHISTS